MARDFIPEGRTIIFEAPQRHGKTMAMVAFALDAYQEGRNIFSNFKLEFPYEPLDFSDIRLEDGQTKYWNGHICIDELNFFFDGRRSMKEDNIRFSSFLLQQKKQGCNLTGTTHNIWSLDPRFRENYDLVIRPSVFPCFPEKPEILILEIENGPLEQNFHKKIVIDCKPLMGLYNTFEVHNPFGKTDKEKLIKEIRKSPRLAKAPFSTIREELGSVSF